MSIKISLVLLDDVYVKVTSICFFLRKNKIAWLNYTVSSNLKQVLRKNLYMEILIFQDVKTTLDDLISTPMVFKIFDSSCENYQIKEAEFII